MNRNESRELRQQRAKLAHDMAEICQSSKPEDIARWKAMDAEQETIGQQIERIERSLTLDEQARESAPPPAAQPGTPQAAAESNEKRYREAWSRCMKNGFSPKPERGIRGISLEDQQVLAARSRSALDTSSMPAELRDMITQGGGAYPGGVGSEGGFFVPTGFVYDVEQAMKFYGQMLNGGVGDPKIMETATGQPLPYPTSNDTIVTGERLSENQQATTNDANLGMITFQAWIYSTKMVKVSLALLQDSAFDIQSFLTEQFATRIGRILNTDFTLGAGSASQAPNGIITAATSAGVAVGAIANDGVGGFNTIGTDDLVTLEHSVDVLYRNGGKYMMHDSTLGYFKKLKDKYGRQIWVPNIAVGEPDTINGHQYLLNNDMDQLQTQATSPVVTRKTLLFGRLDKYLIRRVKDLSVMRLDERFAEFGQVAFLGFARYDGNLLDAGTHPVKYLTNVG